MLPPVRNLFMFSTLHDGITSMHAVGRDHIIGNREQRWQFRSLLQISPVTNASGGDMARSPLITVELSDRKCRHLQPHWFAMFTH
jgi:hypothetical protein